MDDLDSREAFLRATFADPDNDLPRLVFADWLDEHDESAWAELIRIQCEFRFPAERPRPEWEELFARERELTAVIPMFHQVGQEGVPYPERGFADASVLHCTADQLGDAAEFRRHALQLHPEWYGCTRMKVAGGRIVGGKPIQTILTSPVTERVTDLDLSGAVVTLREPEGDSDGDDGTYQLLSEYEYRPTVTVQAVQALVDAREARRLVRLDLRNNDLDNDAARAVVHSPNLIRLKSLQLSDGNQLRGRTWQQLLERFGPDVLL